MKISREQLQQIESKIVKFNQKVEKTDPKGDKGRAKSLFVIGILQSYRDDELTDENLDIENIKNILGFSEDLKDSGTNEMELIMASDFIKENRDFLQTLLRPRE